MNRRVASFVAALLAAVSLSACVIEVHDDGNQNRSSGTVSSSSARTTFTVVNNSSVSIYYIYVSPGDDMSWGEDVLDIDVLAPGEQCEVRLDPGVWDIKCVSESGQELIFWDQNIDSATVLTIVDQ